MFTGLGLVAFFCIMAASALGFAIGRKLPETNRTEATEKAILNVMSVVGILTALVLGLLIASTKTDFDTRSNEVEQFAANLTLLDRELAHFEQDVKDPRDLLRAFTVRKIALTWPSKRGVAPVLHDDQTVQELDAIQQELRGWTPQEEPQREGRRHALKLLDELKRTSRLLAVQQREQTPRPFLFVVTIWLSVLYFSYALFAPLNRAVVGALIIGAFSVSMAINLILDMDQPFVGFVRVSAEPMQQALEQMKP
jgi:hypothetical protein